MRQPKVFRFAQGRTYKTIKTPAPVKPVDRDDPLGIGPDDLPDVEREQEREATWRLLDIADDFDAACPPEGPGWRPK
jgi:hypothetical protein